MRYVGTEKIICPICKVELDVPVYQTDENKKYGMKFCHQCGNKLFSEPIEDFEDLASSILKKIDNIEMCLCNIYNTGYTVQESDEIFIDKQLRLIKAELRK